jgi:hypothetical protein
MTTFKKMARDNCVCAHIFCQGPLLMTAFANSEEKPKMYPPVLVKTVSGKERPVRVHTNEKHAKAQYQDFSFVT